MGAKHLLIFLVVYFTSRGQCFRNGYSEETCTSLVPNQEKDEPEVNPSQLDLPFDVITKPKYRRNRNMEINLVGSDIEGFQLQIRRASVGHDNTPEWIGEFVKWPENEAQTLNCGDKKNTAVTHKNLSRKSNLNFTWRAPDDDEGELKIYDGYVTPEGSYWADLRDIKFDIADLPVSLKDCGKDKSCIHFSSSEDSCDGNTCNYLLTYETTDKKMMEFTLSTLSSVKNSYSAVGFKETEDGKIHLIACIRENDVVDIKYYTLEDKEDIPVAETENIDDQQIDKEDDNFWCKFTKPIVDAGAAPLDFNKELFWIYTWGEMNETSHLPILNSNWHESKHDIKNAINEMLKSDNSSNMSVASIMLISLSSLFLFIVLWI